VAMKLYAVNHDESLAFLGEHTAESADARLSRRKRPWVEAVLRDGDRVVARRFPNTRWVPALHWPDDKPVVFEYEARRIVAWLREAGVKVPIKGLRRAPWPGREPNVGNLGEQNRYLRDESDGVWALVALLLQEGIAQGVLIEREQSKVREVFIGMLEERNERLKAELAELKRGVP
jgi:hypothetical protein